MLKEKAAGEAPSGSVQFQLPVGRQCVLVVLQSWVIIKMPEAFGIRFQPPEEPALFAEKHAVTAFHLVSNILLSGFDLLKQGGMLMQSPLKI